MPAEEPIVPLPAAIERIPPLSEVQSALLGASLLALRQRGHEARYLEHLPAALHETVLYTPTGLWLPVAVAEAHYEACEALELPASEVLTMGNAFGVAMAKTRFSIVTKLVKEGGVTPWTLMHQTPRIWGRAYRGGAVGITKLGPKEARFEAVATPLARYGYWRTALRGILTTVLAPFCQAVHARELPAYTGATKVGYRVSWA
jgi:hypothetical protein